MTDTVNVPREAFDYAIAALRASSARLGPGATVIMVDEALHRLAAAPKAEPVSDPYKLGEGEVLQWVDGAPEKFRSGEWFIAMTAWNDRVCLKALPEEYSYDFTTADGTYIKADKIVKWMPFPDSEYRYPAQPEAQKAGPVNSTGPAHSKGVVQTDTLTPSDELPNLWWNVEDWDETFDNIEDAYDAATGGEMRGIACLGNAIEQARKYVVRVDIDTTGDGGADDYEIRTFDSLEAAERELAKHKGPQS